MGKILLHGGADMEIYEKVKRYLYENIGHMTTAGTPKYDILKDLWRVPVLCKTERGIIVVGEFSLDKKGNFVNIPTEREMLKVAELEMERLPFLYYGTKNENFSDTLFCSNYITIWMRLQHFRYRCEQNRTKLCKAMHSKLLVMCFR